MAQFTAAVSGEATCAATQEIILRPPWSIEAGGELTLIAKRVAFDADGAGVFIQLGGTLSIISADPTELIPDALP